MGFGSRRGGLAACESEYPRELLHKFDAEPTLLPEYERALKLDDGIVRYLITLHEHEMGAPAMSDEEIAAAARRDDDDDDED